MKLELIIKILDVVHDALFLFFKNYKEADKEKKRKNRRKTK